MTLLLDGHERLDQTQLTRSPAPLRQALERSSALMRRAAFEQVPIGKVMQTSDGTLRAINRPLCLMMGYTEVELLTLTVPELVHPEDVARDWEQYQDLLAGRIESFALEKRTFLRAGRAIWGELTLSAIRDPHGQVEWVISRIQALTPGELSESQPGPARPDQEQLHEFAQLGSWDLDVGSGSCSWSEQFYRMLGLEPGSVTPSLSLLLDYMHSDDREAVATAIQQAIALRQEGQVHCRLRRADDCLRQVLIQFRVLPPADVDRVVLSGLMLDVTEQWQKTRLMEQANVLLCEQNRQLDQFVRLATHNLRSPLASAITLVQMLDEEYSDGEKLEYRALLASSLEQALSNLDEMVVQVYHQLPDGLERQNLSFQEALDKALLALATEYSQSRAIITTDFACPELDYVSVYLNSIVFNLVSNGLKYRSPDRQAKLALRSWRQDGKVFLEVEDNGIGIDLNLHGDRIFKLHQIFTDQDDAHGVGLFLTRNQIESLGGEISLSSQPGSGTRFLIRF